MANDGRTEVGLRVDEEWPEAAMNGLVSCTPPQPGKAWGNG